MWNTTRRSVCEWNQPSGVKESLAPEACCEAEFPDQSPISGTCSVQKRTPCQSRFCFARCLLGTGCDDFANHLAAGEFRPSSLVPGRKSLHQRIIVHIARCFSGRSDRRDILPHRGTLPHARHRANSPAESRVKHPISSFVRASSQEGRVRCSVAGIMCLRPHRIL